MEPKQPNTDPNPAINTLPGEPTHRQSLRNVNLAHRQSLSRIERLALWITNHVGTMGFFGMILAWTIFWLSWNLLAPPDLQFDPPTAFVLWLMISNMIQILLMPLIMVGQNLQGRHAELRADSDYEVNVRAEKEIANLFVQIQQQQALLQTIAYHLGIKVAAATDDAQQPAASATAESTQEP